ncbi:hypothetical protein FRB99_004155, partial [Tulasnella sp. 403]
MSSSFTCHYEFRDLMCGSVNALSLSHDATYLAVATSTGVMLVLETSDLGKVIQLIQFRALVQPICCVWSKKHELFVGSSDGRVLVTQFTDRRMLQESNGLPVAMTGPVTTLSVFQGKRVDGLSTMLTVGYIENIEIWTNETAPDCQAAVATSTTSSSASVYHLTEDGVHGCTLIPNRTFQTPNATSPITLVKQGPDLFAVFGCSQGLAVLDLTPSNDSVNTFQPPNQHLSMLLNGKGLIVNETTSVSQGQVSTVACSLVDTSTQDVVLQVWKNSSRKASETIISYVGGSEVSVVHVNELLSQSPSQPGTVSIESFVAYAREKMEAWSRDLSSIDFTYRPVFRRPMLFIAILLLLAVLVEIMNQASDSFVEGTPCADGSTEPDCVVEAQPPVQAARPSLPILLVEGSIAM